jgi:hypothetical protein
MSRSFKKVPIVKYGGYGKFGKQLANKKVRKIDLSDGNNYRRIYESWNIFDVVSNLYGGRIDGIPTYWRSNDKMTYNDIMAYWRK